MKFRKAWLSIAAFIGISAVIAIPILLKVAKDKTTPVSPQSSPTITQAPRALTRQPAVAGQFYPKDPVELNSQLTTLINQTEKISAQGKPRILIMPHAGIEYSGQTAAWALKQIEGWDYSQVILLGPSHHFPLDHAAVFTNGSWETPLGTALVDNSLALTLLDESQKIIHNPAPHNQEHSLEIILIFLQKFLNNFKIVPILLGQPSDQLVNQLANKITQQFDDKTLLIISTDLSHYPTGKIADQVDQQTINAILSGKRNILEQTVKDLESKNYPQLDTCTCGYQPLRVGLQVAELLQITDFKKIKYENSGDVSGNDNRVVGYAAIGAWKETLPVSQSSLDENSQKEALTIARKTLEEYLNNRRIPSLKIENSVLLQPFGTFVTLRKNGQLRGCIGRFEPEEALYQVIQNMAVAAATQDRRFLPVTADELPQITIEVSVMTPKKKIDNWQNIQLGKHGVVVEKDSRSGTFLPQVAEETGWDKKEFLSQLCSQKAGLPNDCYQDLTVNLYTFEAQVFEENKH